MNASLDPAIRDALDRIVAATPALGPIPHPHVARLSTSGPRRHLAVAAAAIALAGAAGALALATRSPSGQTPAAPGEPIVSPPPATGPVVPDTTSEAPTVTVADDPNMVPVPVTMAPDSPTAWYRLQPDLLITWKTVDGTTNFCWRSPIEEHCGDDIGHDDVLSIPSAAGQTIVIDSAPTATSVTVEADDGTPVTVQLDRDPQLGWGVGRYDAPEASGTIDGE